MLSDLKKYGLAEAAGCFNCGNCTALCELSSETVPFPRKIIRYLQLGLRDKLLQSPEPWLCYYCADCSRTCPRQANPGEVMMGLRRYLTARYDPTGIARLFYRSNVFASALTVVLAVVLGAFLVLSGPAYSGHPSPVSRWLFGLIDYRVVEFLGIAVFIIAGLSILGGLQRIISTFARNEAVVGLRDDAGISAAGRPARAFAAAQQVFKEIFMLKRYQSCDARDERPFYLKSWFVHGAIMWGFIGLGLATLMDIPQLGLKDPDAGTFLPSRILGIGAGLFLMYGTSVALVRRIRRAEPNVEHSQFSDWLFLLMLWGLGLTGFWLTISVYFSSQNTFDQWILLGHTVMAMELLMLFAFTKFAHVAYRPIALFFHFMRSGQ
jgi:hypothetical protein